MAILHYIKQVKLIFKNDFSEKILFKSQNSLYSAANGEIECIKVLKEFNAKHIQNYEGNFPLHWAGKLMMYYYDPYIIF